MGGEVQIASEVMSDLMSKLSLLAVLCGILQWLSEAQEFLLGRSVAESSSMPCDRRKKP